MTFLDLVSAGMLQLIALVGLGHHVWKHLNLRLQVLQERLEHVGQAVEMLKEGRSFPLLPPTELPPNPLTAPPPAPLPEARVVRIGR